MIKAKLIVVGGDAKRTEVNLKSLPATIGRGKEATITLPHALVSRQHCEIFVKDDVLCVKDLNSLNGTYLNNQKVQGTSTLLPGQLLTLGNVTFRADYLVDNLDGDTSTNSARQPDSKAATPGNGNDKSQSDVDTDHGIPANDTDEQVLVLDEGCDAQEPSVAVSSLRDLPAQAPLASFNGNLQLDDANVSDETQNIHIDLGDAAVQSEAASQSSLNEFFRKMPK